MFKLMLLNFCILLANLNICISICPNDLYDNTVSSTDIATIVNKHNNLRLMIAQGKVPNQPAGINLKRFSWDSKIAAEAQKIANTCENKHVKVSDERFYVGQNLFAWSSTNPKNGSDWDGAIQAWFNEHKNYKYSNLSLPVTEGHYTQIVWHDTTVVGCGYTYYKTKENWYEKYYVCNYGVGGNWLGEPPYKTYPEQCTNNPCKNLC